MSCGAGALATPAPPGSSPETLAGGSSGGARGSRGCAGTYRSSLPVPAQSTMIFPLLLSLQPSPRCAQNPDPGADLQVLPADQQMEKLARECQHLSGLYRPEEKIRCCWFVGLNRPCLEGILRLPPPWRRKKPSPSLLEKGRVPSLGPGGSMLANCSFEEAPWLRPGF